MEVNKLVH